MNVGGGVTLFMFDIDNYFIFVKEKKYKFLSCNWLYYTTCPLPYIITIVSYLHFYNYDNLFVIIMRCCCIVPKFSEIFCKIVFCEGKESFVS